MILSMILIVMNLASAHADLRFDTEVPTALKTQVNDDLKFMTSLQGDGASAFHKNIFGTVSGRTYNRWFFERIDQVGMSRCGSDISVACVMSAWANKMWFSQNYITYSQPQIARLAIIYHEARHTEKSERYWLHSPCPRPFRDDKGNDLRSSITGALLAGEYACDVLYNGSYGSETILLYNVAQHCTNCSSKVKEDALVFGKEMMKRISHPGTQTSMKKDLGLIGAGL